MNMTLLPGQLYHLTGITYFYKLHTLKKVTSHNQRYMRNDYTIFLHPDKDVLLFYKTMPLSDLPINKNKYAFVPTDYVYNDIPVFVLPLQGLIIIPKPYRTDSRINCYKLLA